VHCAAANGHADTLRALIAAGANVDSTDNHGLSPLREAAAAGHTTAVDVLLSAHADVNAKCKQGYTPLHDAAWQGRADCVQVRKEEAGASLPALFALRSSQASAAPPSRLPLGTHRRSCLTGRTLV
jgi:ankyrin repeat protein